MSSLINDLPGGGGGGTKGGERERRMAAVDSGDSGGINVPSDNGGPQNPDETLCAVLRQLAAKPRYAGWAPRLLRTTELKMEWGRGKDSPSDLEDLRPILQDEAMIAEIRGQMYKDKWHHHHSEGKLFSEPPKVVISFAGDLRRGNAAVLEAQRKNVEQLLQLQDVASGVQIMEQEWLSEWTRSFVKVLRSEEDGISKVARPLGAEAGYQITILSEVDGKQKKLFLSGFEGMNTVKDVKQMIGWNQGTKTDRQTLRFKTKELDELLQTLSALGIGADAEITLEVESDDLHDCLHFIQHYLNDKPETVKPSLWSDLVTWRALDDPDVTAAVKETLGFGNDGKVPVTVAAFGDWLAAGVGEKAAAALSIEEIESVLRRETRASMRSLIEKRLLQPSMDNLHSHLRGKYQADGGQDFAIQLLTELRPVLESHAKAQTCADSAGYTNSTFYGALWAGQLHSLRRSLQASPVRSPVRKELDSWVPTKHDFMQRCRKDYTEYLLSFYEPARSMSMPKLTDAHSLEAVLEACIALPPEGSMADCFLPINLKKSVVAKEMVRSKNHAGRDPWAICDHIRDVLGWRAADLFIDTEAFDANPVWGWGFRWAQLHASAQLFFISADWVVSPNCRGELAALRVAIEARQKFLSGQAAHAPAIAFIIQDKRFVVSETDLDKPWRNKGGEKYWLQGKDEDEWCPFFTSLGVHNQMPHTHPITGHMEPGYSKICKEIHTGKDTYWQFDLEGFAQSLCSKYGTKTQYFDLSDVTEWTQEVAAGVYTEKSKLTSTLQNCRVLVEFVAQCCSPKGAPENPELVKLEKGRAEEAAAAAAALAEEAAAAGKQGVHIPDPADHGWISGMDQWDQGEKEHDGVKYRKIQLHTPGSPRNRYAELHRFNINQMPAEQMAKVFVGGFGPASGEKLVKAREKLPGKAFHDIGELRQCIESLPHSGRKTPFDFDTEFSPFATIAAVTENAPQGKDEYWAWIGGTELFGAENNARGFSKEEAQSKNGARSVMQKAIEARCEEMQDE
eukprot:SAG22_NODE_1214_length_5151_cov_6.092835_1_plen_1018_part_00